jgi:hypothetical protein
MDGNSIYAEDLTRVELFWRALGKDRGFETIG